MCKLFYQDGPFLKKLRFNWSKQIGAHPRKCLPSTVSSSSGLYNSICGLRWCWMQLVAVDCWLWKSLLYGANCEYIFSVMLDNVTVFLLKCISPQSHHQGDTAEEPLLKSGHCFSDCARACRLKKFQDYWARLRKLFHACITWFRLRICGFRI